MALSREKLKEEKLYRRKRKGKKHQSPVRTKVERYFVNHESRIFDNAMQHVAYTLAEFGFTDLSYDEHSVRIDDTFSFNLDYKKAFSVLVRFCGAFFNHVGSTIELDFSKCKKIDSAPVFLLQVIRFEIGLIIKGRMRELRYISVDTVFKVIPSKCKPVNRMLVLCGLITKAEYENCRVDRKEDEAPDLFEPKSRTGYYKGSRAQRHYFENKKSSYTTEVVKYLNACLARHGSSLNTIGQNSLEGIITEILNNAEDHGLSSNWYLTANFSEETGKADTDEVVGELNLAILNFGTSIYDGLRGNRAENSEQYHELLQSKQNLDRSHPGHGFSEEELFTLYALNEGVSRLKYEDPSRGTGTIKFLNSFLKLGDFEDKKRSYIPQLSVFSGKTMLICDNDNKPFDNDGVYLLTLNSENDLTFPPARTHLKELPSKFPGTLLYVHLYLSKSHLEKKIIGNNHADRIKLL